MDKQQRKVYNREYYRVYNHKPEAREKRLLRARISAAVRKKKIKRQACYCCKEKKVMVYLDAVDELGLIWLCKKHHLYFRKLNK